MVKFKILVSGNIAGFSKRFKAGEIFETENSRDIAMLRENYFAAREIIEEKPEPKTSKKSRSESNGEHN